MAMKASAVGNRKKGWISPVTANATKNQERVVSTVAKASIPAK